MDLDSKFLNTDWRSCPILKLIQILQAKDVMGLDSGRTCCNSIPFGTIMCFMHHRLVKSKYTAAMQIV